MEKTKRFDDGGGVGKIVPEDLDERKQSSKNVYSDGTNKIVPGDSAERKQVSKNVYNESVKNYQNELRLDPKEENPVGYSMRKFFDTVGDKVRSLGKAVGSNKMTSLDDKAQMQARKDVKGYKKGGSVGSASKRADGIAQRGKTKGRMC